MQEKMAASTTMTQGNDEAPDAAGTDTAVKMPGLFQRLKTRSQLFVASREFRTIPTLAMLLGVAILLGLGSWQIARLQWKNELLRQVERQMQEPADDLRRTPPPTDKAWRELDNRKLVLQGNWISLHAIKLAPRSFEEQAGYQLILPLRLYDGQVVMIDRGFVPDGKNMPPQNPGTVTVHGIARLPEARKPFFAPDNIPARNQWVWVDMAAIGDEVGVSHIAPVMIYEDRVSDRDSYPIGGQLPLPLHNSHWHYAVTWYALALCLMGVWIMASSPSTKKDEVPKTPQDDLSDPVARRGMYPEATD